MSVETAIIKRSRPYALASRVGDLIHVEASKGCKGELFGVPVELEPHYWPPSTWSQQSIHPKEVFYADQHLSQINLFRYVCYVSIEHQLNWIRSERFLKQLQRMEYRSAFEIIGNETGIQMKFFTSEED